MTADPAADRARLVAVLDALADVETCYRNTDPGGVTHAVGRLLGSLDNAAAAGARLVIAANQLRTALRHEGAPPARFPASAWLAAHGHELEPWQRHVVDAGRAFDVETEQQQPVNHLRAADETHRFAGLGDLRDLVEVANVVDRADVDERTGRLVLDPADTLKFVALTPDLPDLPDDTCDLPHYVVGDRVDPVDPPLYEVFMDSGGALDITTPLVVVTTERLDRPGLYVVDEAPALDLDECGWRQP